MSFYYAANYRFDVDISYTSQGNSYTKYFVTEHSFLRPNNIIPTDLKYEEFKYIDYDYNNQPITMNLPPNTITTIFIRQSFFTTNYQLIIDRIELYPLDQGVEPCTLK